MDDFKEINKLLHRVLDQDKLKILFVKKRAIKHLFVSDPDIQNILLKEVNEHLKAHATFISEKHFRGPEFVHHKGDQHNDIDTIQEGMISILEKNDQ